MLRNLGLVPLRNLPQGARLYHCQVCHDSGRRFWALTHQHRGGIRWNLVAAIAAGAVLAWIAAMVLASSVGGSS